MMGRGEKDKAASARKLLYGPRRALAGRRGANHNSYHYDSIVEKLFHKQVPLNLQKEMPDIAFVSEPFRFKAEGLPSGSVVTTIHFSGISTAPLTVSFVRDNATPIISIDYEEHSDGSPEVASDGEAKFLANLANMFADQGVVVEMVCDHPQQLEKLFNRYSVDNFSLADANYGSDDDDREVLDALSQDERLSRGEVDALRSFDSLPELWQDENGRAALLQAARYYDIYLQIGLDNFNTPVSDN